MKKLIKFAIILVSILLISNAIADEDITGIWEGKLVTGPGSEMTVQFKIKKKPDGAYSALINSPDQGALKNIPASSVSYESNKLKIDVADLNGSFEGEVKDNIIEGKWSQEGTSFPLNLIPYVEPTLSKESMAILKGRWQGNLEHPLIEKLVIVFRFEESKTGDFIGFMDVPAQGARNIPINTINMEGNELTLKINMAMLEYKAKLVDNKFDGKWIQGGQELPLSLEKGGEEIINRLSLSEESFQKLAGYWNGALTTPQGSFTVVVRFEKTKQGDFVGFVDSPDIGANDIPITEASLSDSGEFTFKIPGLQFEYNGQLSENEITGESKQGGMKNPLNLMRGKPKPMVLDLSKDAIRQLLGKWHGKVDTPQGTIRIYFRFEQTDKGEPIGFMDSPDQGRNNISIKKAGLEQDNITLEISGPVKTEYKGKLSGDTITGQLTSPGGSFDVTMERVK